MSMAAEGMPIFPAVGAFTGLVAGVITWSLEQVLPTLFVAILGLAAILLLNGAQHLDGLLDFGDGIMCHGSRIRKLRVMRDSQTGAGGFVLGWITLSGTVVAIASLNRALVVQSLLVSEGAASFSMVLEAWAGKAAHEGMSSIFVNSMHSGKRNLRVALAISLLFFISIAMLGAIGVVVSCTAAIVSLIMVLLSKRAFGGITGDVMGATNELTRLVSLGVILVGLTWL
jgi:adenosylcobinamide-GDP ribazoletransferase